MKALVMFLIMACLGNAWAQQAAPAQTDPTSGLTDEQKQIQAIEEELFIVCTSKDDLIKGAPAGTPQTTIDKILATKASEDSVWVDGDKQINEAAALVKKNGLEASKYTADELKIENAATQTCDFLHVMLQVQQQVPQFKTCVDVDGKDLDFSKTITACQGLIDAQKAAQSASGPATPAPTPSTSPAPATVVAPGPQEQPATAAPAPSASSDGNIEADGIEIIPAL